MILDWDVHHGKCWIKARVEIGNGTQRIFVNDPEVLYLSIHRYQDGKFYPCSKDASPKMVGGENALGKTVNIAWSSPGASDSDYLHAFHRVVLPMAYEYNPDFVIGNSFW